MKVELTVSKSFTTLKKFQNQGSLGNPRLGMWMGGKTGNNPQKSPKFGDRDKGTPFKNIWDTPGTGIVHKTGN